jgi:hypothetical protein
VLGRRFLLLVAVLMGLTALAASIAPREPLERDRDRRAATPTATPTAAGEPVASREPIQRTISASDTPARVTVREGQVLELTVTGTEVDSVAVLDEIEPVEPESAAVFNILADEPGSHPITLLDSGREIGTLVIR